MEFEWDPSKAATNLVKHGVGFPDAVGVFEDPLAITTPDSHSIESRFASLGVAVTGTLIVVIWTWREDRIRLISARSANRIERNQYRSELR